MRIVETKVYNIEELSSYAQNLAYEEWLNKTDYCWGEENRKTLEKFAKFFNIKIKDWEYDFFRGHVRFYILDVKYYDIDLDNLSYIRLYKYLLKDFELLTKKYKYTKNGKLIVEWEYKDCPLTGYCVDNDILEPMIKFMSRPTNISYRELIQKCFDSWISSCIKDYKYSLSKEYFLEMCGENNWEFYSNGKIY